MIISPPKYVIPFNISEASCSHEGIGREAPAKRAWQMLFVPSRFLHQPPTPWSLAAGSIVCWKFMAESLLRSHPGPKEAALPKVTCLPQGQPTSNAWTTSGYKAQHSHSNLGAIFQFLKGHPAPDLPVGSSETPTATSSQFNSPSAQIACFHSLTGVAL